MFPYNTCGCKCKWFWEPEIVVAKSEDVDDFYESVLKEMFGNNNVKYDVGGVLALYNGVWLYLYDSKLPGFRVQKRACITCGTCLGWGINIDNLKVDINKEIHEKYKKYIKQQHAKDICNI